MPLAYAIGKPEPVSVTVDTFGTGKVRPDFYNRYISDNYDLTPEGIIDLLYLRDVNYNQVSSGGHFGKEFLPWEIDEEEADIIYGESEE